MSSFIYFYSKFTEEFLLLGAAGFCTLACFYCYQWVVKKRRLGSARNQIPASMVKVYLNQLINEAQFVRTQLFGLVGGEPNAEAADFETLYARKSAAKGENQAAGAAPTAGAAGTADGEIPTDLIERLKALEAQLAEKEGLVVNVNIEKTKLLEEVETLKKNPAALAKAGGAAANNHDDLINKIKTLEQRLDEYAVFEEDLANLKRLQQENTHLKKKMEEISVSHNIDPASLAPPAAAASEPAVVVPAQAPPASKIESGLDQNAIDALLDGTSAVAPTVTVPPPSPAKPTEAQAPAAPEAAKTATPETAAPAKAAPPEATTPAAPKLAVVPEPKTEEDFEKLVDSVEGSLEKSAKPTAAKPEAPAAVQAAAPVANEKPAAAPNTPPIELNSKTDEELLKEFENLLNS